MATRRPSSTSVPLRRGLRGFTSLVLGVVVLGSLMACGNDESSPTAPDPPAQRTISVLEYTVTFTRFECIADGDGVEGAGEFDFTAYADRSGSKSWERSLSSGQSASLDWSWPGGVTGYQGGPVPVEVGFRCTEWDRNVLGET